MKASTEKNKAARKKQEQVEGHSAAGDSPSMSFGSRFWNSDPDSHASTYTTICKEQP